MSIEIINDLSLRLVAEDFSNGHAAAANNGGPTKTARAMAIIHLAAHDAYAQVTAAFATPALAARAATARLWSSLVIAFQRSAGMSLPLL